MPIITSESNVFEIKEGDTLPEIETVLLDGAGSPLNMTNAISVTLKMVSCGHPRTVVLNHVAATFVADATGTVSYAWQTGDTAVPGKYNIEWRATFPVVGVITIPSKGYDMVEVTPSL
jgi:hypothetical protein